MAVKLDPTDRRGGGNAIAPAHGGRIGNPPHVKTEKMANKVRMLRALGNPLEAIALACDCSSDTLQRHYRDELDRGLIEANAQVGAAIFNSALGEKASCLVCTNGMANGRVCANCRGTGLIYIREPNATSQIWWSKNRMGWTDRERIEHVGDGGGPIITEMKSSADTIKGRLEAIRQRLAPPPASDGE